MPRLKKTLPFALSTSPAPVALLDERRWKRIAHASYGDALTEAVRDEVARWTNEFLRFAATDAALERASNSLVRITAISDAADTFNKLFFVAPETEIKTDQKNKIKVPKIRSSAEVYIDTAIDRHLREITHDKLSLANVQYVAWLLAAVPEACELASKEIEEAGFADHIVGIKWGWWVCQLTAILKAANLRTGASRDGLTSSVFVRFVQALELSFDTRS